jgi:hypothetical protein
VICQETKSCSCVFVWLKAAWLITGRAWADVRRRSRFRWIRLPAVTLEAISKPHLTPDGRVEGLFKMLTYSPYAALFHRPSPCPPARSEVLKWLQEPFLSLVVAIRLGSSLHWSIPTLSLIPDMPGTAGLTKDGAFVTKEVSFWCIERKLRATIGDLTTGGTCAILDGARIGRATFTHCVASDI